ncbi:MAG: hypothetical protein PSY12_16270, partial [bacterium]|nr:hypothetical protein [bacterium]
GEGRLIRLRRRLTPAVMPQLLEADFPHRLRALFDPPAASANRVGAADYAPLVRAKRYIQPPQDIRPWLAILIAALLLAERWVATQRRRGIAP